MVIRKISGENKDEQEVKEEQEGNVERRVEEEEEGEPADYGEEVELREDKAEEMMARPATVEAFDPTAFDKSGGVMDLIRGG